MKLGHIFFSSIIPGLGFAILGHRKFAYLVAVVQSLALCLAVMEIYFFSPSSIEDLFYLALTIAISIIIFLVSFSIVIVASFRVSIWTPAVSTTASLALIGYLPALLLLLGGHYFRDGPSIALYRSLSAADAPAVLPLESYLVSRNYFLNQKPKPGQLVMFRRGFCVNNIYKESMRLARVIGLPGERVRVAPNGVNIDDQWFKYAPSEKQDRVNAIAEELESVRLVESLPNGDSHEILQRRGYPMVFASMSIETIVPPGRYFVLNDNRGHLDDSREEFAYETPNCNSRRTRFVEARQVTHRPTTIIQSYFAERFGKKIE